MGIDNNNSLVFLHIPKTGGRSLYQVIRRQYQRTEILALDNTRMSGFKSLPESKRRKIKIVQGHFGMEAGVHNFLPQPFRYFTILRDPIDRVISTYDYILRNPDHTHYNTIVSNHMSLHDFVARGVSLIGIDNGQTRLLCGIPDVGGIDFGKCPDEMLELAKNNLREYFAVVGIVKRFDEMLLLLQKTFNWKTPLYVKQNVAKKRTEKSAIPQETMELIRNYNRLDMELYRYAEGLFNKMVDRQGPAFSEDLTKFKALNKIYEINKFNPLMKVDTLLFKMYQNSVLPKKSKNP